MTDSTNTSSPEQGAAAPPSSGVPTPAWIKGTRITAALVEIKLAYGGGGTPKEARDILVEAGFTFDMDTRSWKARKSPTTRAAMQRVRAFEATPKPKRARKSSKKANATADA